jgi:hypothetical protein
MAVHSLPNPKKSSIVNFPISEIKKGVDNLSIINRKYKLTKTNDVFNQYSFSVSEFLSNGAVVDIDLNEIDPNKTEIIVEVKRVYGTFDQPHEVSLGQTHIQNVFDAITKGITDDVNQYVERNEQQDINSRWFNRSGYMILWALLFWPIAAFGLTKSSRSMTFKVIIGLLVAFMAYQTVLAFLK